MRWIDLVLLLILASFAANGVMQGMLRQLAAMAGFLVGLIVASVLYEPLAAHFATSLESKVALGPLFFVVILLSIWILANLLGFAGQRRARDRDSSWLDELGGALLGLITGVLLLALLASGTLALGLAVGQRIEASIMGAWLLAVARRASMILREWLTWPGLT